MNPAGRFGRRASEARRASSRGATLVEYALGVGLVAVAVLGALQVLSKDTKDSLATRGDSIGHPVSEGGATTTTTLGGGGGGGGSTTTTTAPGYSGTIGGSCTGSAGNSNNCVFSLSPDPAPTTPTWSLVPATGFVGVLPSVTFIAGGSRTVRADVGGVVVQRIVDCTVNGGGKITCDLA